MTEPSSEEVEDRRQHIASMRRAFSEYEHGRLSWVDVGKTINQISQTGTWKRAKRYGR